MTNGRPAVVGLTPRGVGGVAVLQVHPGPALRRLQSSFRRQLPRPNAIAYGTLAGLAADGSEAAADGPLDEVLLVGRPDGSIEVHMHGSPALVEEARRMLAGQEDAAAPGPIGLEERALEAVGGAASELGARVLLDQAAGALRAALRSAVDAAPEERARAVAALVARGRRAQRLLRPARVVLVGAVNAGKSTLFNAIAGEALAAVTDVPGTTRDALGARARLGPWPILLVDTAGERDLAAAAADSPAAVERAGQELAREVAAGADLVLELRPVSEPDRGPSDTARDDPRRVAIRTRAAQALGSSPEGWGER
ncbi:MAG: GTPase, partial [Planctomycetota bacterium]